MEIFRYTRDMYGQETLQGISWDLIPVFAGATALFIICHLVYSMVTKK
ncbi:MAG: hypothetical protein HOJ34_11560 [Kordiimonadaceae bacterium]|jgi:hypothetical protein|nr:hypothetical protein [Kordiimonadaceae bacterium]MBT6037604.1 hypothetical protein [Kordiimonadaceae bacterium]MBT6330409.1 hypothetical protein [Kordiimonadaceae bacterium]MBT7583693.1 hypothetical protein [Kordiimonadaceae bacterium]